jgi:hypothetical protein
MAATSKAPSPLDLSSKSGQIHLPDVAAGLLNFSASFAPSASLIHASVVVVVE